MKNDFENYDFFFLYLKHEKERIFKQEIFLFCFLIYKRKLETKKDQSLLALPPYNKEKEERKEPKKINDSKEEASIKNDTLKDLEALLQNSNDKKIQEPIIKDELHLEPNSIIIKNLISRLLKLYFKHKESNLNFRAKNETDKVYGYYYWDKKQVARHLISKDYSKILTDKYDIQYSRGKHENIPLALYFDLSESMIKYSNIIADIALVLLRNDIKVLIGYNEKVKYQINKVDSRTTSEDLKLFFKEKNHPYIESEPLSVNIDTYLINKKCEKCIIVSDYDSYRRICNLSKYCEVYLLYCLNYSINIDDNFQGISFNIESEEDIMQSLLLMSKNSYNVLKNKQQIRKRSKKNDN